MQIDSKDLWDVIEVELIKFKNRKDLDQIMCQKFESLVNHFNGNVANNMTDKILGDIRVVTSTLSNKGFYTLRNIDKSDYEELTKLNENLILLDKILVQEIKLSAKEKVVEPIKKERLPNIDNDKSMRLFERV